MVSKIKEQMNKRKLVGAQPEIRPSAKMVFTVKEKFLFFFCQSYFNKTGKKK